MKQIHLCLAHMSEEGLEQRYVNEAFETNWVSSAGPNLTAFEEALEQYIRRGNPGSTKRVIALNSGTAAIHLALIALGVGAGDEVLVQSFTFCASAYPVNYMDAVPVLVDSERATWNMDPALLEEAIRDRIAKTGRKPKAIISVSLYGMPCLMQEIHEVAARYGIPVIEDAAEGFGSSYDGRPLGSFGDYGILSFSGNKMITCSSGGALVCPDEASWKRALFLATQAKEPLPYYQHEQVGFNYRMSNICAGIGRGQLTVADQHVAHHQMLQRIYEEQLGALPGFQVHRQPDNGRFDGNYWLTTFTVDPQVRVKGQEHAYEGIIRTDCEPNANIEALRAQLNQEGIEARPLWKPMHRQPVYKNVPAYVNGVSEELFKTGLCLPTGPCVSEADARWICERIKFKV